MFIMIAYALSAMNYSVTTAGN